MKYFYGIINQRRDTFLLFLILFFAFLVRLYRFDSPIADWHSWRQADTSSVSREFVKHGFDLLHPKYHDLSKTPSGLDNLEGYRFVEFPIFNILQAGGYVIFDYFSLEEWGRLVSIISSVITVLFIYLLCRMYLNSVTALVAGATYAFLPFSIYYVRVILPEPLMNMAIICGIYFFALWAKSRFSLNGYSLFWFVLSLIFTSSALLIKPFAIFFTLPMVAIAYVEYGFLFLKKPIIWIFLIAALVPLIFWRVWMSQFPSGIPASDWLFNGGGIRFKGAYFYWIYGERLAKLILGYFALTLLLLGIFKHKNGHYFLVFLSFLTSSLLYLTVVARGNVQHDYYQILILPTVAIFIGRGVSLVSEIKGANRQIAKILILVSVVFSISLSWFYVRDYYNTNYPIVEAGKKADEILPQDALVIAPLDGDTSFLYQTNRRGWPVWQEDLKEMVKKGADYLVIAAPTEKDVSGLGSEYEVVASSSAYLILKLGP